MTSLWETFGVFLRLGLTCFGGPVAHLGYFREEFVVRRQWLTDRCFADLVALSQFLPGPSSSQVNMAIGWHRGGFWGAWAAWIGFTLPSALAMVIFAWGWSQGAHLTQAGWLEGLKLAAVAVVAQAVWAMGTKFCRTPLTLGIALLGTIAILATSVSFVQVLVILVGSGLGFLLLRASDASGGAATTDSLRLGYGPRSGSVLLAIFFVLLAALPLAANLLSLPALSIFDRFYRAGSLVFGGGHVILPLLQEAVVPPGWVDNNQFLAGYGMVQAVPGPLFSYAAFLGYVLRPEPHGLGGAFWCLAAIYLPAALLMFGALPFWETLRHQPAAQGALRGANAAVVGVLLAAFIHPVCSSSIHDYRGLLIALGLFSLLFFARWAPWLVVALAAALGQLFLST